ncbi:MAG: DUF4115 domain-containing protein [Proteobacteria bacterium]|nr:DUF4115 domain-containing protein [Pseudomonadota bacterium]
MSAEEGVGIGARLRAARERRGLTTLQAAEKLHVEPRVLECLEGEDFAALGAEVYVRGHLRRYADFLGESARELQDLYAGLAPAARPDLTRIPRGERPAQSQRLMVPALTGILVVALAGIVWWAMTLPGERPHALPPAPAPDAKVDNAVAAVTPAAAPAAVTVAPAPAALPHPATATQAAVAGGQTLTLHFSGESWAQVADAHGRLLLDGLQGAGASRSVSGAAPLRVVLGNAPAVALEVNGRPASLAAVTRRRGDAHFSVDATGELAVAHGSGGGQ